MANDKVNPDDRIMDRCITDVVADYDLGQIIDLRKTEVGLTHRCWIVDTPMGRVVVREAPAYRSEKDIDFEHSTIRVLAKANIPYALPVPLQTHRGHYVVRHCGRIYWIYRYIEGTTGCLSRRVLTYLVPQAMATLHNAITEGWIPRQEDPSRPFDLQWLVHEMMVSKRVFPPRIGNVEPCYHYYRDKVDKAIHFVETLTGYNYDVFANFPIHCDWNPDNLVVRDGHLVGILDFGNCREGTAIQDIAMFLCRTLADMPLADPFDGIRLDVQLARKFISHYRRFRPLGDDEVRFIPLIAASEAADSFWWQYKMLMSGQAGLVTIESMHNAFERLAWYIENGPAISEALVVPTHTAK